MFQIITIFVAVFLFWSSASKAEDIYSSKKYKFKLNVIADGLEYPWALAFLPNGDIILTERAGRLRIIQDGKLIKKPISNLPKNLYPKGQGGLLDIELHPEFKENKLIYLSYAGTDESGKAGTEIIRAQLKNYQLQNVQTIFKAKPKTFGTAHYGSRLLFLKDGTLLATIGERYKYKDEAQNIKNHLGSIIRITDDGAIPKDNPFFGQAGFSQEIYAYGTRNSQGIAARFEKDQIWFHEHGPRGGDELNILKKAANYGWPAITYGIDYSGAIISDKTSQTGMEQPIIYWDPSIAPSGMMFYHGNIFPKWSGNIFMGALAHRHLRRIELDEGNKVISQEILLPHFARIRDVRVSKDGYIYFLTDSSEGQLIRIEPAD